MPEIKEDFVALVRNKNNIKDPKGFKVASASIICNIIDVDDEHREKYCNLFQREFELDKEELQCIKENIDKNVTLDENIKIIKEKLHHDKYEIMLFLKTLNKFIIIDGCSYRDYAKFETIKNKFME